MSLKLFEDNNSKMQIHLNRKDETFHSVTLPLCSQSPQHCDLSGTFPSTYFQQPSQNNNPNTIPSNYVCSQKFPYPVIPSPITSTVLPLQIPSFQLPKIPNFYINSPNSLPSIPLPYYTIFLIPVPLGSSSRNLQLFLEKFAHILAIYIPPKRYYAFAKVKTIDDVCIYYEMICFLFLFRCLICIAELVERNCLV
jgi:hypothetical protein